jgi:hypothetical protein
MENCSICYLDFDISKPNVMRTKCNHLFHASCILHWTSIGHNTCPYCIQVITDKTLKIMVITDPTNILKNIFINKIYINEIPYFIYKNRIFYSPYYRDDENQTSDDLKESIGLSDEIGIYDKNTNSIIYTHDNVKLLKQDNEIYILTDKNKVFRYDLHLEIGIFENGQIVIENLENYNYLTNKRSNFNLLDTYSDLDIYDENGNEIGNLYFYFSGQIYRKDNFTKENLKIIYND